FVFPDSLVLCLGLHSGQRECDEESEADAQSLEIDAHTLLQAAVTNCGTRTLVPSISAMSSSVNCRSAAPTFCSTCCGLRAPTMVAVIVGLRSPHGMAICPGGRPYFRPTFRKRSTRARFFDSLGSRNSGSRLRQSLSGNFAVRSRGIDPVKRTECLGA